ncbi:Sorbin and SH3 domain-containing protein 2 [Chytriomyces hyalinus]|nr:Sorbin and SH3 domain-containing protein 2 [Chytriomyces hyalinus]
MASAAPPFCLPLKGTSMCPDFADFSAYIPITVSNRVTDISSFDALLKESTDTSTAFGFGSLMRATEPGGYQCTGWEGDKLRYFQSVLCGYFVGLGQASERFINGAACNPTLTKLPLCAATANAFENSWDSVQNNATICPKGPSNDATVYKNVILSTVTRLLSTDSSCLVGGNSDVANCGFASNAEKVSYCASTGAADSCCGSSVPTSVSLVNLNATKSAALSVASTGTMALTATALIATMTEPASAPRTTPAVSTNQTTSSALSFTQLPIWAYALGGAGLLVILIAILLICCIRKSNQMIARSSMKDSESGHELEKYQDIIKDRKQSIEEAQNRAPQSVSPATPRGVGGIHRSVYQYEPAMPDELGTQIGDEILLTAEYEDGWGQGQNLNTSMDGFFPLGILESYARGESALQANDNQVLSYNERVSSSLIRKSKYASVYSTATANNKRESKMNYAEPKTYGVVEHYIPEREDELELYVGEKVELTQEYDDGWGFGTNLNSNAEGVFPLFVLDAFSEKQTSNRASRLKRMSSLYARLY